MTKVIPPITRKDIKSQMYQHGLTEKQVFNTFMLNGRVAYYNLYKYCKVFMALRQFSETHDDALIRKECADLEEAEIEIYQLRELNQQIDRLRRDFYHKHYDNKRELEGLLKEVLGLRSTAHFIKHNQVTSQGVKAAEMAYSYANTCWENISYRIDSLEMQEAMKEKGL